MELPFILGLDGMPQCFDIRAGAPCAGPAEKPVFNRFGRYPVTRRGQMNAVVRQRSRGCASSAVPQRIKQRNERMVSLARDLTNRVSVSDELFVVLRRIRPGRPERLMPNRA